MPDIFISYSSKDRENAEQLTELLTSAGLHVWIDKTGIDIATSWSEEIVDAIDNCKVFIVILSSSSIASHNVVKEVALASEKRKKIVPLDLEPVEIPKSLQYALAGIQRCPMTNIDRLIRTIGKFGLEATSVPKITLVRETDSRKSLMILPFEDLSPTADNQWFADGIVSEMISSLTNVKSLKVTNAQTTKEFKNYKGHLALYAKEMGIRYFVQGDVRKFGDNIKITSRLLDIETGDHLWQESMKGTMDDIFDIQESVARHVVKGLRIILTEEEDAKIEEQPTGSAEAYELYLKAKDYYDRHTRVDMERSLGIYEEVVKLDPEFADAYIQMGNVALSYYRTYSRENAIIERVSVYISKAESLLGESAKVYWIRGTLERTTGQYEESLRSLKHAIELDPGLIDAYESLAMTSALLGNLDETVVAREKRVHLQESDRNAWFSYLLALNRLGDIPRLRDESANAIPVLERYLRLAPDDLYARSQYVGAVCMSGEFERGLSEGAALEANGNLDGYTLFNLACAFLHTGNTERGLEIFRKSVDAGYSNMDVFRIHPDLASIRMRPEFESIIKGLEEKIESEKLRIAN
jgi:adenylate cyclase